MKTIMLAALAILAMPTAAFSQTAEQPIYDRRVACRELPFPISVLCLASRASYIAEKQCPEIGQTSLKPAGQQCDAGRTDRAPAVSRDPKGRCSNGGPV